MVTLIIESIFANGILAFIILILALVIVIPVAVGLWLAAMGAIGVYAVSKWADED